MSKLCTDHLGNEFNSIKEMCEYWNISELTYKNRIRLGWSLKNALTKKLNQIIIKKKCKDHLGNEFDSVKEMCEYWNISKSTYDGRLNRGCTLEQTLTGKSILKHGGNLKSCKDHLGNEFESITKMCEYWNIKINVYKNRIGRGWTLEDALTKTMHSGKSCKDHLNNEFDSIKEMCEYWNVNISIFKERKKQKYSDLEILGIIPILSFRTKTNTQITKELKFIKSVYDKTTNPKTIYYICENQKGLKDIYTRNELINLIANEKGLSITYNLLNT